MATRSSRLTPRFDQVLAHTSDLGSSFTQLALSETFGRFASHAMTVRYMAQ